MKESSMHKAEHDLKAIMYPAYSTHRLRTIRGNEIQLTQNLSELWKQGSESAHHGMISYHICTLHELWGKEIISNLIKHYPPVRLFVHSWRGICFVKQCGSVYGCCTYISNHGNGDVVILMKVSSLAALEDVKMTIYIYIYVSITQVQICRSISNITRRYCRGSWYSKI